MSATPSRSHRRVLIVALAACVVIAVLLVVAPRPASAQQGADDVIPILGVSTAVNPTSATVGDHVTLSIVVRSTSDVLIEADPPEMNHVDLLTADPPTTALRADGQLVTTFIFVMQPFHVGPLETGTLHLHWLRDDGSTGTVDVSSETMLVVATRTADDDTLRGPKPQAIVAGAPPAWLRPAIEVAVVAVALLIVAAATFLVRRRLRRAAPVPETDTTPERLAREQLDGLAVSPLPVRGDYQSYYGGMALAVREYLSARFGFNAHALTTTELERRMVAYGVDRWQARLVGGLLERCDGAIYGRRYPDPASADHDLTVAYEIVELSRPRELPVEGEPVTI